MTVQARLVFGSRPARQAAITCVLALGLLTAAPRAQDHAPRPPLSFADVGAVGFTLGQLIVYLTPWSMKDPWTLTNAPVFDQLPSAERKAARESVDEAAVKFEAGGYGDFASTLRELRGQLDKAATTDEELRHRRGMVLSVGASPLLIGQPGLGSYYYAVAVHAGQIRARALFKPDFSVADLKGIGVEISVHFDEPRRPPDEPPALKAALEELKGYSNQTSLTRADIDRIAAITTSIGHDKSMFPR